MDAPAGLRASPLSVHTARAASAYGRRFLLAAPSLHQIAERVERRLQTLLDRVGVGLRLPRDRATRRRDVGSEREVRHHLGPTVLFGDGQPSRIGTLVGTPLNAAPGLIDTEPAVVLVGPASDLSVDLDPALCLRLYRVHRWQERPQVARVRNEREHLI